MKRWRPPSRAISSWPGVRNRWNVFPSTMSKPSEAASRTSIVFTTALVASGTKAGVRTSPWASFRLPLRARPALVWISNTGARTIAAPLHLGLRSRDSPAIVEGSALDRLRSGAADLDAARLVRLGLRDRHLEHAVVEAGRHGLG